LDGDVPNFVKMTSGSPLLDKQDFRKLVRLGRAMDAAVRFQPFRRVCTSDPADPPYASTIFNMASKELAELLDLIPEQTPSPAPVVQTESKLRPPEEHGAAGEPMAAGETPPASVAS
jgi:hypothetical protein